jgi:hypothetical protein
MGGDNFTYTLTPYFTDVPPTDFGFQWIQKMADLGITSGCGPSLFCPNDATSRAEIAVFIIRARYGATANFDYPATPYFTDVAPTDFGFSWIQRMKLDNITSGCTATTYCPDNIVSRGDAAIFIMAGEFNQLLPANTPVLSAIDPATLTHGTSGLTPSRASAQTLCKG